MEDKGIISKKVILFITFIALAAFFSLLAFLSPIETSEVNNSSNSENTNTPIETKPLDESFIYGKYINEQDEKSYIEITKDSYTYVMNNCERYYTYKSDTYIFTKKVTSSDEVYNVDITLTSSDTYERLYLKFSIKFKLTDSKIVIYGPGSCSGSRNFIKS